MHLEKRLQAIDGLAGKYGMLKPSPLVASILREGLKYVLENEGYEQLLTQDVSDMDDADVISWLQSVLSDVSNTISVWWLFEHEGVTIASGDFCEHYDDLWHPSSDDLLVVCGDGSRLVELHHEEVFAVFEKSH